MRGYAEVVINIVLDTRRDNLWNWFKPQWAGSVKPKIVHPCQHRHQLKLGYYIYLIGEIPSEIALNYLSTRNYGFNSYGEILMTEAQHTEYQEILKLGGIEND